MIGDRMKESRLKLGYSAEQVAEHLGISPATIYRYENGDISKLPSKYIKPLADYLCVTPAYLMGWSDSGPAAEPDVPKTIEARIVSGGMDKLPKEQREQVLNVVRAMFAQHPELFEKEGNENDPEL